jgi:hypothetical protein
MKYNHDEHESLNNLAVFMIVSSIIGKIIVETLKISSLDLIPFTIYDGDTRFYYRLLTELQV